MAYSLEELGPSNKFDILELMQILTICRKGTIKFSLSDRVCCISSNI